MSLNVQTAVGQWVAAHPETARVFEQLKIDYCCGGSVSLEDACARRQLDPEQVAVQLQRSIGSAPVHAIENWSHRSLTDLCNHIEETHHAYLRRELPRLEALIAKVVAAHQHNHPELPALQRAFASLRAELEPHMFKEEQVLFPAIRSLESATTHPGFFFGTVANPIRMMEHEHDHAGNELKTMRDLTRDFQVPGDACNTYRVLLHGLEELEYDLHTHIHKENNLLFPRAQAVEDQLSAQV
jgi:regulator of cell morphogenesis and NO signaling